MNVSLTHINPVHSRLDKTINVLQGIKIHLTDGSLLGDVRDCSAGAGSFYLFNLFVKEI